jgi:hypothetical protein
LPNVGVVGFGHLLDRIVRVDVEDVELYTVRMMLLVEGMLTYICGTVQSDRNSRYWRCTLHASGYCFGLPTTNPLFVGGVLHGSDVATVMLEVEREDSSLPFVP